jgi:hypothetical protein
MNTSINHIEQIPYHGSVARFQVCDGRDSLQTWRVVVNKLNKQSWIN